LHVRSLCVQCPDDRCNLFRLWPPGSGVLDTNVGSKLFVALAFILLLHFIQ
jgi:hypothetical protein